MHVKVLYNFSPTNGPVQYHDNDGPPLIIKFEINMNQTLFQ